MPASEDQISIPFDRKRMRQKLLVAIFLMALSLVYIFITPVNLFLKYNGYFFIFFSLILAFYPVKRLITNKPGFLINAEGIHDYTGAFHIGPILWRDITNIRIINNLFQKIIVIDVNNTQDYINRQKNGFNKMTMNFNHIFFGGPFCIRANDINISLNDLFEKIDMNFKKNKATLAM